MRKKNNDSKFAMPTRTIHHLWKNHASNFSFKRKWNLHFEKYASRCHPAIPIFLMLQHSSLIDQACFRGGAKKNIVLLCYISCQFLNANVLDFTLIALPPIVQIERLVFLCYGILFQNIFPFLLDNPVKLWMLRLSSFEICSSMIWEDTF